MNILKFSHDYEKLPENWEGTQALLIGVQRIFDMDSFKQYLIGLVRMDTMFRGEKGFYPLDFKVGIILTFFHCRSNQLFTTIRRYTPEKFEHYEANAGETFELVKVNE